MKRLFILALPVALALTGCNKADSEATSDGQASNASGGNADVPAVPKVPIAFTPQTGSLVGSDDVPLLEQINRENVKVLAAALPAIVRITASRPVDLHMELFGKEIPYQFHLGPNGPRGIPQNDPSYGSGVVIGRDGLIVTNDHVIEDSKNIMVQLQDKRTFPARIVASDGPMDVTVLKIEVTNLSPLPWGDSDRVHVGEQVFAIGNPFNLEDSASKGIVSATGRNLPDMEANEPHYENYIQTDAAINPGNSGGALVNIHGELIGINTAIASTSRGNMGVGFAIPSNLVRYAVEGLLKEGKLVRGYLGVRLPESVDDGVSSVLNLGTDQGALLAGVQSNSPADKAGLKVGDFITDVDGHKIGSVDDLRLVVSQLPIGKEVTVKYIRTGAAQSAMVKIGEIPKDMLAESNSGNDDADQASVPSGAPANADNVLTGIQVNDLNDQSRKKFGVDAIVTAGVVVDDVQVNSMADEKGIEKGDVIESASVDRGTTRQLTGAKDFADVAQRLKPDQSVVLLVHHGKAPRFIFLAPEK